MAIGVTEIALVALGLVVLKIFTSRKNSSTPLPPGPKGYPVIGNMLGMPKRAAWKVYSDWADSYSNGGPLTHTNVLGQDIVFINTIKAATDLLEKKSGIYSDRPQFKMAQLTGWEHVLICTPYGDNCRLQRKLLHRVIGSRVHMQKFHNLIENEVRAFAQRLLKHPEDRTLEVKRMTTAISMLMAYGYEVKGNDDPVVAMAEQSVEDLGHLLESGSFLVELFPWMASLPDWFPGTGFKQVAKTWANTLETLQVTPFEYTKKQVAAGTAIPSIASEYLDKDGPGREEDISIRRTAANIYGAGSDTTTASISTFFLVMTLYPEIQKRAQAELDSVVGTGRLPTLRDRENLPFLNAVVKEVTRWRPIFPLAIPHRLGSDTDDVYDGMLIPNGSIIIPNTWRLMRDPEAYKNPLEFNPDRFLGEEPELNPFDFVFGYGRRTCPGNHMADAVLFETCATVLSAFDLAPGLGEDGKPVKPSSEYEGEAARRPKEFPAVVKPRSRTAEQLVTG